MLSGGTTTMLPYIKSGKLRGLAISATKRLAAAPDIPSYTEQGYPTVNFGLWHGCLLYTSPSPRDGLLSRMPSSA